MSEVKKYKLIKGYPNSLELGAEVEFNGSFYQTKMSPGCSIHSYRKDEVEGYPEFWEEVKEEKLCVPVGTKFSVGKLGSVYRIDAILGRDKVWVVGEHSSTVYCIESVNHNFNTNYWIKCKPLFKTNNNVDIFEGDTFYFVGAAFWGVGEMVASDIAQAKQAIARFSTKVAAENYIKWNKPAYSAKQVIESVADVLKEVGFIKSIALEVSQKIYSKLKLL